VALARTIAVGGCLLLAAGCAQAPIPAKQPFVFQETLTGVQHWRILAEETAQQIDACLAGRTVWDYWRGAERPVCPHPPPGIAAQPLFVEQADGAMPFGRAFHGYVTAELLGRGRDVSLSPEGATHVRYRVQLVPRAGKVALHSLPGGLAVLGTAIWALDDTDVIGRLVGAGALADLYFAGNAYGGTQVVITTTLTSGDRLVMHRSNGYYVHDADLAHYASLAPAADLLPPPAAKGTPQVRAFAVVAE
jgi:hypothetical protein